MLNDFIEWFSEPYTLPNGLDWIKNILLLYFSIKGIFEYIIFWVYEKLKEQEQKGD